MIKREEILADLHMHTVASLHGYSTIKEMADAAKAQNLKYIAITDHLYQTGDVIFRKNETARIEYLSSRMRFEKDLKIIGGVELNLHQNPEYIHKFKRAKCWMPCGLHSWFLDFEKTSLDDIYNYFYEKVNVCTGFAHIERDLYKINDAFRKPTKEVQNLLIKLLVLAKNYNIPVELNETSFVIESDPTDIIYFWLGAAKELEIPIYLGTDAHYYQEVGRFDNSLKALNYFDYPKDLILNLDENKLKELLPEVLKD